MQNSSAFQYLAIDTIHESATNPRRTFEEVKLQEFADYVPGNKTPRALSITGSSSPSLCAQIPKASN
jgi:hypothetical protein